MQFNYAKRATKNEPSAIKELLRLGADPEVISFGGGYPDPDLFPLDKLSEVYQSVITEKGRDALQYAPTEGLPALRQQIIKRMKRTGVACTMDEVMVISGGQQGLDLVAKIFINPGDVVIVESPTFLGALLSFKSYEPTYVGVPMEDDGMSIEALEVALKANPKTKFIYTIPEFHNPTGVTMSLEKRKALLALAKQYNVLVLEDSPYREIRYEGEHIPSIKSMDDEGRVIHLGSFSKILCPGLRLGWVNAHPEVIAKISSFKLAADTQNSTLNMYAVNEFLETHDIDAHIDTLKNTYKRKKDIMLKAMAETFPEEVKYTIPEGGLFSWVTLPERMNAVDLMHKTLAEAKVAYVPGFSFFPEEDQHHHFRLNFSYMSDDKVAYGIAAIGNIIKKNL